MAELMPRLVVLALLGGIVLHTGQGSTSPAAAPTAAFLVPLLEAHAAALAAPCPSDRHPREIPLAPSRR
jgi:hypothetical protein